MNTKILPFKLGPLEIGSKQGNDSESIIDWKFFNCNFFQFFFFNFKFRIVICKRLVLAGESKCFKVSWMAIQCNTLCRAVMTSVNWRTLLLTIIAPMTGIGCCLQKSFVFSIKLTSLSGSKTKEDQYHPFWHPRIEVCRFIFIGMKFNLILGNLYKVL